MSLILDALKRAERERQAEPLPARTPDVVAMPGRAAVAPRDGRRWVGAVITLAGLALAALLLWDAFRAPAPPQAAVAAAPPPPEPQAPVIKARPAPPPPTTAVPGTEAVTSLDDLTDESSLEAAQTPALVPAPAPAKQQQPVPSTAIATRPAPPPATSPPQPVGTPPPAPKSAPMAEAPAPAPAAPPESAPAPSPAPSSPSPAPADAPATAPAEVPSPLTQPAPLRKFREMPPDYRADFPALRIEIHVFEQERPRRFVIVNGRKYREGERMAEGPALVEIVPEGLVLEYRGEKVLYTLGR